MTQKAWLLDCNFYRLAKEMIEQVCLYVGKDPSPNMHIQDIEDTTVEWLPLALRQPYSHELFPQINFIQEIRDTTKFYLIYIKYFFHYYG